MTDSTAVLDPRQAIEAATRHTATTLLYTRPVLDDAAALLADLWATAEHHGVRPDQLDVAYRCLEAVRPRWRTGIPQTIDDAQALLHVLLEEFATLGVAATFNDETGLVLLPRGPRTPTWGYNRPYEQPPLLAVTATLGQSDGGWDVALNRRGSRMVEVSASCDRAGAAAVAQLAIEINAGGRGNPFRWA
jgi:hypothetical protein